MPHFPYGYLPCGTFNPPLYLGVITHTLTLKASCLERNKYRDLSRIGSDTMSKSGFGLNLTLQNLACKVRIAPHLYSLSRHYLYSMWDFPFSSWIPAMWDFQHTPLSRCDHKSLRVYLGAWPLFNIHAWKAKFYFVMKLRERRGFCFLVGMLFFWSS